MGALGSISMIAGVSAFSRSIGSGQFADTRKAGQRAAAINIRNRRRPECGVCEWCLSIGSGIACDYNERGPFGIAHLQPSQSNPPLKELTRVTFIERNAPAYLRRRYSFAAAPALARRC